MRLQGKIISFCNKACVSGQQTAFYKTKLGVEPMSGSYFRCLINELHKTCGSKVP